MLVIRLFRTGKKNQPFFKIVVTDKRRPPRAGRFLENLGFLNPLKKEKKLNAERIKYWLSVGAKPSDTIHNLLVSENIIEGKKIDVHKKAKKKEAAADEGAAGGEVKAPVPAPAEVPAEEKEAETSKAEEAPKEEEKPKEEKKEETPKTETPPAEEEPKEEEKKEETT